MAGKKTQLAAVPAQTVPKEQSIRNHWKEFEIEETYEYDVFERIEGNREIDEGHVVQIMKWLKAKDLKVPIQINQNFGIIDGQHRLEARKRLGLPVYFFVTSGFGLEEVQTLNAQQKRWTLDDYVKSFIERGNQNYAVYQWFRKQFQLPHNQSVELLVGHNATHSRQIFISGQFVVRKDISVATETAKQLARLRPYFDHWNTSRFLAAMLIVMRKKVFDFERFISKLKAFPTMLKPQTTTDAYLQHIEDIYNYRTAQKVGLRFADDDK